MATASGSKKEISRTSTRESTSTTRNVDMGSTGGAQETSIKETSSMTTGMDTARCFGKMAAITKGSGKKDTSSEREKL